MAIKSSNARKAFVVCNTIFLTLVTCLCVAPVLHLLAVSLSDNVYAVSGDVLLWPKGFTLQAYSFLASKSEFLVSLVQTIKRVVLGVTLNMSLCVLTAYPLSKEHEQFRQRTAFAWFFAVTMFFGGGLIPTYMVVRMTGISNTIWALVLPGAVTTYYVVMMLNFFRGIPKSLEEAARLDGAGHVKTLILVYLPLSLPSLATIFLFTAVNHWNAWFDGYIYMSKAADYPLSTYLYTLIAQANIANKQTLTMEDLAALSKVGDKTLRTAQIFLGALPIMMFYPFLQRFFIKGIVLGSVKE